jgi:thiosulfate dehydrogenase
MMFRWMAAGAALIVVLGVLAAYAALSFGLVPANADARPSALERWAARTSLHATIAREASSAPDPLPITDDNLDAGIKLYAANCMVCHAASDAKSSNIASGLYQHPPRLAEDGVEDNPDGEIYWKIAHGIRLTGMPAFGSSLTDSQIWQLTMFLKQMDKLPPGPDALWKKQPSVASATSKQTRPGNQRGRR